MARTDLRSSTRFEQQADDSYAKYVLSTLPLAVVMVMFVFEAYQRPNKPFYNMPAFVTDDYQLQSAAEASGSLVPLMDMLYVVLAFTVPWALLTCYNLVFLRLRHEMIDHYLANADILMGNVVYERKWWACEFRYYGYCSYQHPDDDNKGRHQDLVRKTVRMYEPYTRELVPVLCLPGFPKSGQGKDDVEYASLMAQKARPRELFFGRFSLFWLIICISVAIYLLHVMYVIDEAEYYAGITDDYENADKGWILFWMFLGIGVIGAGLGGSCLAWLHRRWWLLHQGVNYIGDLSIHGFDGGEVDSQW